MRKFYYLLFLLTVVLVGCYRPTVDRTMQFFVDNQSDAIVGMVSSAYPYGEAKLKVKPKYSDSLKVTVYAKAIDMGTFELCNLSDTTKLFIPIEEYCRIFFDNIIETEREKIIVRHLKPVVGVGYYWTVTDELILLMEKDMTLVDRYPEFYQ